MDLRLDLDIAERYHSGSQRARVLTETWVGENMFCPRCGREHIVHFDNNMPVADFYCPDCESQFELKSRQGNIRGTVADGAYETMISRITGNENPDFLFLSYSVSTMTVTDLIMIPKYFFVPDIIERRPPLPPTARRAGWVGCNIHIDKIPEQGRIEIVRGGLENSRRDVLEKVDMSRGLDTENIAARGWLMDVLNCVNSIPGPRFELADIYAFEHILAEKHRDNHNIRPKIRQQLQLLRDKGIITFEGNGKYEKL